MTQKQLRDNWHQLQRAKKHHMVLKGFEDLLTDYRSDDPAKERAAHDFLLKLAQAYGHVSVDEFLKSFELKSFLGLVN